MSVFQKNNSVGKQLRDVVLWRNNNGFLGLRMSFLIIESHQLSLPQLGQKSDLVSL